MYIIPLLLSVSLFHEVMVPSVSRSPEDRTSRDQSRSSSGGRRSEEERSGLSSSMSFRGHSTSGEGTLSLY